ncbi:endophilin [Acrasis kona]|uniref:Endophilin n=1 Tax=Acrasis kona TaxID=1008807 RepID=A0AAW2ZGA5_9EUKA
MNTDDITDIHQLLTQLESIKQTSISSDALLAATTKLIKYILKKEDDHKKDLELLKAEFDIKLQKQEIMMKEKVSQTLKDFAEKWRLKELVTLEDLADFDDIQQSRLTPIKEAIIQVSDKKLQSENTSPLKSPFTTPTKSSNPSSPTTPKKRSVTPTATIRPNSGDYKNNPFKRPTSQLEALRSISPPVIVLKSTCDNPKTAKVIFSHFGGKDPREAQVNKGDTVQILEERDNGWCVIRKLVKGSNNYSPMGYCPIDKLRITT